MRCISLWQPWASGVALELKGWETRGWGTQYRGRIAIHAAKKWNQELETLCEYTFRKAFESVDILPAPNFRAVLPFGAIVCTAELFTCEPVELNRPSERELPWGDYSPGRFVWKLINVARFTTPLPYKGRQGFFEVPDDVLKQHILTMPAA